jgi:phosphate transport system permease protein
MNNDPQTKRNTMARVRDGLQKRRRAEKRFRAFGLAAIIAGMSFLSLLFISIISNGYTAFWHAEVQVEIYFDPEVIDPQNLRDNETLSRADYNNLVRTSLRKDFPEIKGRQELRALYSLISSGAAFHLRKMVMENPALIGTHQTLWLVADDDLDMLMKGHIDRALPQDQRRITDHQLTIVDSWIAQGKIQQRFNVTFFTAGDSREPEQAGIWGAVMGSIFTLMVTLALSFPLGVATAVYLEEFAPRNKWTDIIEVNINNLAAVPSIVFGLLGLAVFINFFSMPRSAPLVGGLVLTLMTLPTIIIASRAALKSVPPSIREAALGVGASKVQMIVHHVLPLALPGMLTGTIIGMAQALGETAPLLMIGMVAFIVDIPNGVFDPATALPVQIFLWADSPERAFVERTSAAIMVLLAFLILMNTIAVLLRKKFERRW